MSVCKQCETREALRSDLEEDIYGVCVGLNLCSQCLDDDLLTSGQRIMIAQNAMILDRLKQIHYDTRGM